MGEIDREANKWIENYNDSESERDRDRERKRQIERQMTDRQIDR